MDDGYWIIWHSSQPTGGEVFAAGQLITADLQRAFQRRLPSAFERLPNNRNGLHLGVAPCDPCATQSRGLCRPNESRGLCPRSLNRWASFTGNWFDRKSLGNFSAYNLRSAGIMAGFDRKVTRNSFGGIAFGYDNAFQKFDSHQASNRVDTFRSMLYGGIVNRNSYADGYIGYTKNWHQTRRNTNGATARSKFNDDLFSTGFELGRRLSLRAGGVNSPVSLTPSIGLHYIHLSTPGITESGAGAADLFVRAGRYNSLRMPMGAKLSRELYSRNGFVWTPELRAYYIREFADDSVRAITSLSSNRSTRFLSDSGSWGRNSGRLGAGLGVDLTDRINFRVDYDYEVFDHTALSELGATLGVKW